MQNWVRKQKHDILCNREERFMMKSSLLQEMAHSDVKRFCYMRPKLIITWVFD